MSDIKDVKDILRGGFASLFGFSGRMVTRAILLIFAGQVYGIKSVGLLGQVAAVSEILAGLCVLGLKRSLLDMLSAREIKNRPTHPVVFNALIVSLLAAMVLSTLVCFYWYHALSPDIQLLGLVWFAVPAYVLMEVALTALRYKRVVRWDVLSRCAAEPWTFLLAAVGLWYATGSAFGLIIAYVLSLMASATVAVIGLSKLWGLKSLSSSGIQPSLWPDIIKQSAPVGITDLGTLALRRLDLIVLSFFVGPDGTGLYYMIQQLVTVPHKIGGAFQSMLSPVMASLHNQQDSHQIETKLANVCRWILTCQWIITIPMIVYGDSLLSVFGTGFAIGATALTIVLLAELIDGSILSVETPLIYAHPKVPPTIMIVTLIILVIAIAAFASQYGVFGAAIGYLIAISVLNFGRLLGLKAKMNMNILSFDFLKPLLSGLIVLAFMLSAKHALPETPPFIVITIAAGLFLYAACIRLAGLTRTDKVLWRLLRRNRKRKKA